MKNIAKYLLILSALAVAFTACKKESDPFQPGEPEVSGCYGVYFPVQDALGNHTYDPEMDPVVDITVARTNTTGAVTVPVKVTASEEGVFVFDDLTFADGQSEATLHVDFSKAGIGTTYSFSVTIDGEQYASKYNSGAISADFSVLIVSWLDYLNPVTNEPAEITLYEGWWGEVHMARMRYYEVNDVRTCVIYSTEEGGIWGDDVDANLQFTWYLKEFNGEGNQLLEVKKQYFGFDYDGWDSVPVGDATSPIYVYDNYWRHIEVGTSGIDQFTWLSFAKKYGDPDGSYPVGYYDGNGGFIFTLRYYIPGLGGFSSDPYEFQALADGFTRVDYSLELDTDYSSDGVTPVYVEAGIDITTIKYAVVEGSLSGIQTENKIAELVKDPTGTTEVELETDEDEGVNYATLELSPETSGDYTVIVLGYDAEGKNQAAAGIGIHHISAADTEEKAVVVSVFTEDTPARYQELHAYDSFAYGVSGKNLTEVHIGIFTEAIIAKNGAQTVLNAVKTNAKSYGVPADVLAEINADGGYYDVLKGLAAKTVYYVIVWATNGDLDDFAIGSYQTERLPYVWNSLGTGQITDGFFTKLFSNKSDYTANCAVYEEANTPGLYMITGYQCSIAAQFFGISEETMAQYENGNWKNTELIVDATDPNAVYIPEQDYGVCVNSSYGFTLIDTEKSGTLKDGVITFPVKEMYVGLGGGWYYGNLEGNFKIVLPSAVAEPLVAPAASTNGFVQDVTLESANVYNKPVVKYERDPQTISVPAEVSYVRKEKNHSRQLIAD